MRSGDAVQKTTLRMALAAIKNAEIQEGKPLDEKETLRILQKEVKSRKESIREAQRANRPDLVHSAEAEIAVLEKFLPQALSQEALENMIKAAIEETGAGSPREMGKVMRVLMPRIQGRADGKLVSELVRKALQG